MSAKKFTQKPIEAYQFDSSKQASLDELKKEGVEYNSDSGELTGKTNSVSLSDGDYVSISDDGTLKVYGKDYFESNYAAAK